MDVLNGFACVFGAFVLFTMIMLTAAIKIVPESQRLTVYRLGRYIGERGPGLVVVLPFIDKAVPVDVQDQMAKTRAIWQVFDAIGETTTFVDKDGSVEIDGRLWNATSPQPIPPGKRVRVTKVILEVEISE